MAALRAGRPSEGWALLRISPRSSGRRSAGYGMVWSTVGGTNPDAVTLFAAAAAKTSRIGMGTAIVPTYPRHPIALASQALVLGALAPDGSASGSGRATARRSRGCSACRCTGRWSTCAST